MHTCIYTVYTNKSNFYLYKTLKNYIKISYIASTAVSPEDFSKGLFKYIYYFWFNTTPTHALRATATNIVFFRNSKTLTTFSLFEPTIQYIFMKREIRFFHNRSKLNKCLLFTRIYC